LVLGLGLFGRSVERSVLRHGRHAVTRDVECPVIRRP
jgi:hypothetical protein